MGRHKWLGSGQGAGSRLFPVAPESQRAHDRGPASLATTSEAVCNVPWRLRVLMPLRHPRLLFRGALLPSQTPRNWRLDAPEAK
eukprot:1944141-Alexandrium_andersonii.AAC.1